MKNKKIIIALASLLAASIPANTFAYYNPELERYSDNIKEIYREVNEDSGKVFKPKYIKGYPDGNFKPSNAVSRAEAVSMFVNLLSIGDTNPDRQNTFTDVKTGWYVGEINYAVSKGFIKGYDDNTFRPDAEITRAEFANMIAVFVKDGYPEGESFKDVRGHWASDAINELYGNKLIKGYPDGSFKPDEKLTRAEAVVILNSVFGRATNSQSLKNINQNALIKFNDVDKSHWAYYEILDASNSHITQKTEKANEINIWI